MGAGGMPSGTNPQLNWQHPRLADEGLQPYEKVANKRRVSFGPSTGNSRRHLATLPRLISTSHHRDLKIPRTKVTFQ